MFATGESNAAMTFDCSADFNFHFTSCISYLDNNSNNFTIVEINDIIWLQVPLHRVTVDSKFGGIRWLIKFTTDHLNYRSASNSDRSIFFSNVGKANFTASQFNVEGASFVGSQSLGLFESINEFQVVFETSV